jgi:hypothetical protein
MSDNQNVPQPDSALRRLDRLVGTWTMEGNLVGSDEKNIRGQTTFRWLPGGFFSGFSPTPLPYRWDLRDDRVTITVAYAPLDATFTGSWREDDTFSGGWRPNPGADQTVNVPYDIGGHRLQ